MSEEVDFSDFPVSMTFWRVLKKLDGRTLVEVKKRLEGIVETISATKPGAGRAMQVHKSIEHYKNEKVKEKASCRKGCSACCHQAVSITDDEATLIWAYCKSKGIPISKTQLLRQKGLSAAELWVLPRAESRCVFLGDDDGCKIYNHRPSSCRNYMVSSDPKICEKDPKGGEFHLKMLFDLQPELIAAAHSHVDKKTGNMADKLLHKIKLEETMPVIELK